MRKDSGVESVRRTGWKGRGIYRSVLVVWRQHIYVPDDGQGRLTSFVLLLVPCRVGCSILGLLVLLTALVEHLLEELELTKCRKDEEQERCKEEG